MAQSRVRAPGQRARRLVTAMAAAACGPVLMLAGCLQPTCRVRMPSPPPELRIATDAAFEPFHVLAPDGTVTGFDVELARAAARRAGYRPTIVVVPFEELLSGLDGGAHDMVAATIGITPERELRYLFSTPYFHTAQVAVVRAREGEPVDAAGLAGLRVGYTGDGTSARAVSRLAGAVAVALDASTDPAEALIAGRIDAFVVDEFEAVALARRHADDLRVIAEPVALERYAFVFSAHREELRRAINRALAELRADGELAALRARFGLDRGTDWPVQLPAGADLPEPVPQP